MINLRLAGRQGLICQLGRVYDRSTPCLAARGSAGWDGTDLAGCHAAAGATLHHRTFYALGQNHPRRHLDCRTRTRWWLAQVQLWRGRASDPGYRLGLTGARVERRATVVDLVRQFGGACVSGTGGATCWHTFRSAVTRLCAEQWGSRQADGYPRPAYAGNDFC